MRSAPGVVHHRLLERSEATAAHDDDDDVVERVIDSYALDRDLKDALWLWGEWATRSPRAIAVAAPDFQRRTTR